MSCTVIAGGCRSRRAWRRPIDRAYSAAGISFALAGGCTLQGDQWRDDRPARPLGEDVGGGGRREEEEEEDRPATPCGCGGRY